MAMDANQKSVQGIKDKKARKEAYYTLQRRSDASKGSPESRKIEKKLGFGGDIRAFAKDTTDSLKRSGPIAGLFAAPEFRAARATGEAAGGAIKALSGSKGSALAKRGEGFIERAAQRLKKPTPVKKVLEKGQKISGAVQPERLSDNDSSRKMGKLGSGKSQKALPSSRHSEFDSELSKMAKKGEKMPSKPKTFNRNGTKRAEGRQKSERNPVSKRKKKGE